MSQKNNHGRPRCTIGNIAPIISANAVITSAHRVTGRRQPALTSLRIAEMSVPAWLMPIQNTKFVMSNAQKTGQLSPQTPMPRSTWYANDPTPSRTMPNRTATRA